MSQYKLALQGLECSQAIFDLLEQYIANELLRTYLGTSAERLYMDGSILYIR